MFELTEEALQLLINEFVGHIKQQILEKKYPYAPGYNGGGTQRGVSDKKASGNLYNSITGNVKMTPDGPVAELGYADYFEVVNLGRRPGFHMNRAGITSLLEWIKIRGVRFRNERGQFRRGGNLAMAFAIERNIFKYGIKPANIYDSGMDGIEDYFIDFPNNLPPNLKSAGAELFNAVSQDINVFIDQIVKKEL